MTRTAIRNLVLIWLAWCVILIGYMMLSSQRFAPSRPDDALIWTAAETRRDSNENKPYLLDPFFNTQVAWDSEFYLSIATVGYHDPLVRLIEYDGDGQSYSLNSAFFPFYPLLMRAVRIPFAALGMTPIAASTAAGLLISLLGTLAGMIALYDIVRDELGEAGGIRTAYMLIIFPTALFLATVYTEGLFVGLAFGSLALMRRRRLWWAALLAALATWTRAVGAALVLPLLIAWVSQMRHAPCPRGASLGLLALALPVGAYAGWRLIYGQPFDVVEEELFGNGILQLGRTVDAWRGILERAQTEPQTAVVVALTIGSIVLALVSIVVNLRRYTGLALFGLAALLIPLTGGWTGTQSTIRYVLAVPTIFVMLGQWGRSVAFERSWTLLSILLLAMFAFLFSYDFWVA